MATCLPSRKLYKLDEPDTQDTAGEARTNSSVMYSYGPPSMAKQKQDDQLELTYSSYVRTQDVTLKTFQIIGRSGERGSGIYVLAAQHDDDDDDSLPEWTWEWWQWRDNLHSPKLQDYRSLTISFFSVISRLLVEGVLPFCKDAICVFYRISQLDQVQKRKSSHLPVMFYLC